MASPTSQKFLSALRPEMTSRILTVVILVTVMSVVNARIAFEKLTDMDYGGVTYYTIRNLSLYECQGWCREEPDCQAASFSFVTNPLAPVQETVCLLQNKTSANNPAATPQRAVSVYYMVKLHIRTEHVCKRPWTFERVPNKLIRGLDNALIFTSTKEACLAACLNERRVTCRSAEYNYVTLQCHLSEHDRRVADEHVQLIDAQGVDYFENLCLQADEACHGNRVFQLPRIGVPDDQVSRYVDLHYYVDKELMANSVQACRRACEIENEYLCRSFLYKGPPTGNSYNCQLFHLDHWTLPDGPSTYLSPDRPLIDTGERIGSYYENVCEKSFQIGQTTEASDYETTLNPYTETPHHPVGGVGTGAPGSEDKNDVNCDSFGTCYDVSVHCKDTRIVVQVKTNKPFNGRIYALGRSETCNVDVINSDVFRLDLTMTGQDCNTQALTGVYSNTVVVQHHSVVMTKTDKIYKVRCTYDMSSKNITFGMMPVRDPAMISITSAPEAPAPRIQILDSKGHEVQTVRIGDRLTFRIEIPPNTPYGIFARSCVAMAKDSKSTFAIIDDEGCPVDPTIFPRFVPNGNALESIYEAFRFTESYGVIFQCNVRYCLGQCEPARCQYGKYGHESIESWGRKKRGLDNILSVDKTQLEETEDMTLSQEILVLDFDDEPNEMWKKDFSYANDTSSFTYSDETITMFQSCPTRTSVLALAVTCALLLLIYVCTVFYFLMRRWMLHANKVIH